MRTASIFLGALLLALSPLRAGDELEFAVPDEGRITLGVFDGSGKLVRLLHRLAKEEDFRAGLNGLITSWDGKNDAGLRVSPGHYYVRGYLVGEGVRVSGEDFLFNDWAADPGFPGFDKIKDFSLLENGDVILFAGAVPSGNLLARFSSENGFLWSSEIKPTEAMSTRPGTDPTGRSMIAGLAANSSNAFVITGEEANVFSLDDGKTGGRIHRGSTFAPTAVAANESRVFISSSDGLTEAKLPGLEHEEIATLPAMFTSMDADAPTLIGASPDGVWVRQESFQPVKLPTAAKSVTLGMPGTFWFVGTENDVPFVGQASFAGEILRTLRPAAEDPKPEKIRASRTAEKFAVIESLLGLQRLRVMARAETGGWTIEWERTLRDSANFGFVDGKPAAEAGGAAQDKDTRIRLKENPLTGKHDFLTLHAEFDASGSRLVSPDGLPLVEVSTRADIRRIATHRGDNPDTLRLLQGNGAFVEEFSISGLDDILPLDAGGIDLP